MPLAIFDFALHLSALSVWFWLTVLIGLVWLRRHLDLNRGKSEPILAPTDAAGDPNTLPRLSVLVAAKDEEANIGTCLEGLARQEYPGLEIIVINDRSTDRTAAIIDEFAARDPRVKPVHVQTLPPGWFGKHNAMREGMEHAQGDYLCFTDADCRYHAPELLAAAMRFAQKNRIGFLSVLPVLEAHTFWEHVVQPPAGAIMVFWFPPAKVNNPDSPRAYANGAFMLMSREVYNGIGGHEVARQAFNEDMRFAQAAKREGYRLFVARSGGMYSVRMYVGFRQVWRGWSRIFYGCFETLGRLLVSTLVLSVFSVSPYVALLAAPFLGTAGAGLAIVAAGAVVAQQSVLWRFYALCGAKPCWALSYPLGATLCAGMMVNSMTRYLGLGVVWRGTRYRRG